MENVLATLVGWFSLHNIMTNNLNLKTNARGQVEVCSGILIKEIPDATHRKLLEREYKRCLKETDFRFCKSTITIYRNSFQILSAEAKFKMETDKILSRMPQSSEGINADFAHQ